MYFVSLYHRYFFGKSNVEDKDVLSLWVMKMEKIKSSWKILVGGLVLGLLLLMQVLTNQEESALVLPSKEPSKEEEIVYIYVDIKGQVQFPGVYKVREETRLFQVVQQAGGLTRYADSLAINLSMKLYDQSVVYIPHIEDEYARVGDESTEGTLININQASLEDLMDLPGVGQVTAEAIINYRTEVGGFSKVEDLINVPGIGEATYERLKDLISIS